MERERVRMIPVAEPFIGQQEIDNVNECVRSGWISSIGKFVSEFEQEFSKFIGVKHSISTANGTCALHLALIALGIGKGDEVIVPSFTFIATANAVSYTGATPIFVDVEKRTGNIDVTLIEEKITEKTKAIIPVHLYGHPCNMDKIVEIAKKHNFFVVEDCAEALGAEYKGKKVGSMSDISCFSFYGNKIITTGEGGMCSTNDDNLRDKMVLLKNHGMTPQKRYWHNVIGFNYRMTNLQAALGLAQLGRVTDFIDKRREHAKKYNKSLSKVSGLVLPVEEPYAKNVYWMYNILVQPDFGMSKEELRKKLKNEGVDTRPLFYPLTHMPMYKQEGFPIAEELSKKGFSLPSSVNLTDEDIHHITTVIGSVKK